LSWPTPGINRSNTQRTLLVIIQRKEREFSMPVRFPSCNKGAGPRKSDKCWRERELRRAETGVWRKKRVAVPGLTHVTTTVGRNSASESNQ
jgi:hypothetical protein